MEPLAKLRGSKLRTNEFRPNTVFIYEDRIEDHDQGVLKKSMQTIRMDQVAQVREDRGLAYTSLIIESTGGGKIHARGLSKSEAAGAKRMIDDLTARARQPHQLPPPPQAQPVDTVSQLSRLVEMHEAGHLTADEFAAQKAVLLGTQSTAHLPPPPGSAF